MRSESASDIQYRPHTIIVRCRTSVAVHANAAFQHPLSTVVSRLESTIVVLQTKMRDSSVRTTSFHSLPPTSFFHRTIGSGDIWFCVKGRPIDIFADRPLCCKMASNGTRRHH
ncbi:hypothetical protein TNCV_3371661 [Trichonephila clavipes]|nr:hypothetical protein TNCV_3371661 [Trichonephila clavipes]